MKYREGERGGVTLLSVWGKKASLEGKKIADSIFLRVGTRSGEKKRGLKGGRAR